ncbi:uncharacterized protein EAF02_010724 [Botrytis sinoallii]|uniref:uncharacterized protein n=1 Tax=Botrytis sinoallii TaxID=1463999 RepID=UPI001900D0CA|nr:uncharacterized protein EAF02_010724 [Botrytis sinoallii]KAF7860490.1 hypothetical protein EAF02_010724 [Botrytis sinoallii]
MEISLFCISNSKLRELKDSISIEGSVVSWLTVNNALATLIISNGSQKPLQGNLSVAYDGCIILDLLLPKRFIGNSSLKFPITFNIHPRSISEAVLTISELRNKFNNKYVKDIIRLLNGLGDITEECVLYAKNLNSILVISIFYKQDWCRSLGFQDALRMANPFLDWIPRVLPMPVQRIGNVDLIFGLGIR